MHSGYKTGEHKISEVISADLPGFPAAVDTKRTIALQYTGNVSERKVFIMVKEFKEFISKGNVMDMAVGIIIGGAFTAIVNSLVESILMPIIGVLSGGLSVADMSVTVGNAVIGYGAFLQAIIDFLLVALVLFSIIKALNKAKAAVIKEEPAEEAPEEVPADIALLTEIRDLLKK